MTDPAFLPFCRPTIEDREIASVVETMRSSGGSGPKVLCFEELFRARLGVREAVALNSGTAGLHVALAASGVGVGDEVVTTSLTWPSTVNVIELLGARPVFADVLPGTLLIDPEDVRRCVSPRTKAIVPVHFAGQPADLDRLRQVVAGRPIAIIEDAAHALGARYKGREIGAGADAAVFSFHPLEDVTTGEGGMVTTDDDTLAERMRVLSRQGVSRDAWSRHGRAGCARYEVIEPGWEYDMLDLQAALGIEQIAKLERFKAARRARAERYTELLARLPEVRPLARVPYEHEHAWRLYIVRLDPARLAIGRDEFMAALDRSGIGVGLHFTPVHLHRYYREKYSFQGGDLPATEKAGEEILSLPLYPQLTVSDQERVVAALRDVVASHRVRSRA